MSFERYVPDIDAWIAHFSGTDHLEHKKFHIVKEGKRSQPQKRVSIKMVSPIEQAVNQAKAQEKMEPEPDLLVPPPKGIKRSASQKSAHSKRKRLRVNTSEPFRKK